MKKVIFLCKENACRSQIAETFAKRFGKGVLEAFSAGTQTSDGIDPMTRAVLKERGFETEGLNSKGLDSLAGDSFDLCVHFGCAEKDIPPKLTGIQKIDWGDIADPRGKAYAEYRKTRELIGNRVMGLIRTLRGNG